jgi:hypothetical protein
MGRLVTVEAEITAGQQFLGTEFRAQSSNPGRKLLQLKELTLQMGTEAKTFRVERRRPDGTITNLIQQSTDDFGAPATTTDESLMLKGSDVEVTLDQGEQIQITTAGATSAMRARILYEEVPVSSVLA